MLRLLLYTLTLLNLSSTASLRMVKDFNGYAPHHPQPCLMTCVGSTGSGHTNWEGEAGRLSTYVDMSECGFVDTPIVTTTLPGNGHHDYMVGMTSPFHVTKTGFTIILLGKAMTTWEAGVSPGTVNTKQAVEDGTTYRWNVSWHAVGYICE